MHQTFSLSDLLVAREHFAAMWATATADRRDGYRARLAHCDRLIDQAIGYTPQRRA
ncbi:hypothetical protein [Nesterenkonia flava]|uniref:Uncharacterized protein n=1 Tax=Nesterenkonia flava TaxID=469799 RepID=A0ABU1FW57_9MICC|nr:hypothetical protein [Nesterenkonia flava]MDR5712915.1 hypothetical protein [Nesterenkonia flava]